MEISDMLRFAIEMQASDLHIVAGRPPILRIHGDIMPMRDADVLSKEDTKQLTYGILNDLQKQRFEEEKELDFSLSVSNLSRFRVNVHFQRGSIATAFRLIPNVIRGLAELKLPPIIESLCDRPRGLILVTGPTGSGKSTTLAAMIDIINSKRPLHIITIEDPIEYLHNHKKAIVEQREVNEDTHSFANALKYVLRQDPDVIQIGEMRDIETISAALTAAETGHLVVTTLHTNDVVQTIDRVIDVFPPYQQTQVRIQLSSVIQAVMCQQLLPTVDGRGRIVCVELMISTAAISSLIREGKTHQIYSAIETGGSLHMQTRDRALAELFRKGHVTKEVALSKANKPEDVQRYIYSLT